MEETELAPSAAPSLLVVSRAWEGSSPPHFLKALGTGMDMGTHSIDGRDISDPYRLAVSGKHLKRLMINSSLVSAYDACPQQP